MYKPKLRIKSKKFIIINKQWFLYLIVMICVFQPISFNRIPLLKMIFNTGRLLSFLYIFIYFIKNSKQFSNLLYYECLIWVTWLFPTLIYSGNGLDDYVQFVTKFMICTTCSLCFEIMLKKNSKIAIYICDYIFSLYTWINLVLAIFAPKLFGNDSTYFLGSKNAAASVLILFILFKTLKDAKEKNNIGWKSFFSCFLVIISGMVMNSETTRNLSIIFLILLIVCRFINQKLINFKVIPIIYLMSFLPVIIMPILQKIFKIFLEFYSINSNRDLLSFSGRTYIWDMALELFIKKPIFGYGIYRSGNERINIWSINEYCHNEIMEILVDGGVVLLFLFLFLICTSIKKMSLKKNNLASAIITIAFLTYAFDCIFEAPIFIYTQVFFMLITIAYHCKEFQYEKASKIYKYNP